MQLARTHRCLRCAEGVTVECKSECADDQRRRLTAEPVQLCAERGQPFVKRKFGTGEEHPKRCSPRRSRRRRLLRCFLGIPLDPCEPKESTLCKRVRLSTLE